MRSAALLLGALLLLTGCTSDPSPPDAGPKRSDVDVNTPKLREIKEDAGVQPCRPGSGAAVDHGLPELTLACLGGGDDVELSSLRGPLVINLWASWCTQCRGEMPLLQQFHEEYGDRVPVLGVDWQDVQVEAALELARDTGVTYPLLADPNGDWGDIDGMPVRGLPGIVLLDADGRIAYRNLEVIESMDDLTDLVRDHLGVDL